MGNIDDAGILPGSHYRLQPEVDGEFPERHLKVILMSNVPGLKSLELMFVMIFHLESAVEISVISFLKGILILLTTEFE